MSMSMSHDGEWGKQVCIYTYVYYIYIYIYIYYVKFASKMPVSLPAKVLPHLWCPCWVSGLYASFV